jgi:hypothetical protein
MIATSSSLLLLAALLGVVPRQGRARGQAEGGPGRKAMPVADVVGGADVAGHLGHAALGGVASGTLTAANDGADGGHVRRDAGGNGRVAHAGRLALAAPRRAWLALAIATAMLAGAGLVAVAGARLGRACGGTSMTARAVSTRPAARPAWLAGGLGMLCSALFAMHRPGARWVGGMPMAATADDMPRSPWPRARRAARGRAAAMAAWAA